MRPHPECKPISSVRARHWIRERATPSADLFHGDSPSRELAWQQGEATLVLGTGTGSLSTQSRHAALRFDRHSYEISLVVIGGIPDIRLGIWSGAHGLQVEDPLAT
jgi:hypothetical protein